MDTILDVQEVQDQLDKAARDAKHGPAAMRAGRFVHRDAMRMESEAFTSKRSPDERSESRD